jgi:hypothetical protein
VFGERRWIFTVVLGWFGGAGSIRVDGVRLAGGIGQALIIQYKPGLTLEKLYTFYFIK